MSMINSSIVMEPVEEDNQRTMTGSTRFSFKLRRAIESTTETVTNSFVETQFFLEFKIKHIRRRFLCDDPYDEVYCETYPDPPYMFRRQLEFRNLFSTQVSSRSLHLQLADELLYPGIVPSCRWHEFIEDISFDIKDLAEYAVRVKPREIGLLVEVEVVKTEDYNEEYAIAREEVEFPTLDDDDDDQENVPEVATVQASIVFLHLDDDGHMNMPAFSQASIDDLGPFHEFIIGNQASIELLYFDDDHEVNVPDVAASRASIDALERMKFDRLVVHGGENMSCSICLDEYSDGVDVKKMLCSHMFHTRCIDGWLEKRNSCPLCRFKMPVM